MIITLAITGASGSAYALRLAQRFMAAAQVEKLYVVLTKTAKQVTHYELAEGWSSQIEASDKVVMLENDDFFTSIASGSNTSDVMVIAPCSMGMAARIAHGVSNDLISRVADVALKEGKKLILVPRETPFSLVHLRNLVLLKEAGAIILPASPSFYCKPQTIDDLLDTVVERVLMQCGVENKGCRWM